VFGAGGGTSSYREVETAEVVVLWGSNARETHPIFFHHVLAAVRRGARLFVVDPRRTPSAQWAERWLGVDVGADIALAHAMGREIITAGLVDEEFVAEATTGFAAYREAVGPWTLDAAERVTGVAAADIAEVAGAYAAAPRAQLCWTLGITEHHNAVDNVLALINLALLTGHVGREGSGLNPLRGQNNVQGGGDMGAIPNRLPGFADLTVDAVRAPFEAAWGRPLRSRPGLHLSLMFEAMARGELRALYVIGENPAGSEADVARARAALAGLDHLVVQDLFLTRTAELAHVVLPAAADWCEAEGTVTSSERRVQLMGKAVAPPGAARPDLEIVAALAGRLGHDWGRPSAEAVWDEVRSLSPMHAGMSYRRLEELGGIQWPCPDESHPGSPFLHGRLWDRPLTGPRAPFSAVAWVPPADELTDEYPVRLTTGRRLDSYNTGVQSGAIASPLRRPEALCISAADGARFGVADGSTVVVTSRRGSVTAPVTYDPTLRAGLAFLTLHFADQVDTNLLTNDAWDPKSGTAEFKATAVRIEPVA
jgi:predicted molibdopterin-dependent oxidoreductase YjgC